MKLRRHHNNKGLRQIKRGRTIAQVKAIAHRLNVRYGSYPAIITPLKTRICATLDT
ncbi:MAG: hypothetical protein KME21_25095 [Desmonostoc vinosum HA7617-LM4]|jgi:hypothetical protein|nr:hypothetical protein [Desmonostoc vinosum HA7617-LM4]